MDVVHDIFDLIVSKAVLRPPDMHFELVFLTPWKMNAGFGLQATMISFPIFSENYFISHQGEIDSVHRLSISLMIS